MRMRLGAWAVTLMLVHSLGTAAQEPTLAVVVERASEYVAAFHRQFAGVVAEERYEQEVKAFARRPGQLATPMRTELRSDLLLVRPSDRRRLDGIPETCSRSTRFRSATGPSD